MQTQEYRRRSGLGLTYTVQYEQGYYSILCSGLLKKKVADVGRVGIPADLAGPNLMLSMAIVDIEGLLSMDE